MSDEIYHQQVTHENRTSRLDVSINGLEETEQLAAPPLHLDLIHKSDTKKAKEAARRLLDSGELTETQRRRFLQHFVEGLSYRQIAGREGVYFTSVHESIEAATAKLKKFLKFNYTLFIFIISPIGTMRIFVYNISCVFVLT